MFVVLVLCLWVLCLGLGLNWWLHDGFVVFERWCSVLSVTLISCFIVITIVWMFV